MYSGMTRVPLHQNWIWVEMRNGTILGFLVVKNDEMVGVLRQQAMGSLIYVMLCIQSNLAYLIKMVNRHMANLSLEHWIMVKSIFLIFARHLAIQIMTWGNTTSRGGWIL